MTSQMRVSLTEAEQRIVEWIAKSRFAANRRQGVENKKVGPQTNEQTDRDGFGAELAFCKLFNCYPDFSIEPRRGSDDCELWAHTIDVKATKYDTGRLLAVRRKSVLASDIYALMIVEWPVFRFAGFANAKQLLLSRASM